MTRKESEVIVEAIFDVAYVPQTGESSKSADSASFRTRRRQPRIGRNPRPERGVEVPAIQSPISAEARVKDVVTASVAPYPGAPSGPGVARAGSERLQVDYRWTPWRYQSS